VEKAGGRRRKKEKRAGEVEKSLGARCGAGDGADGSEIGRGGALGRGTARVWVGFV